MSEIEEIIRISPPAYIKNSESETMHALTGFRCPACKGSGAFLPQQVGRDEYEDVICEACGGTGRLKAEITIRWRAAAVSKK
jgi:DnaJ-class molecular chaperone